MSSCTSSDLWVQFLDYMQKKCSLSEFQNWLEPIKVVEEKEGRLYLEVPNIFVQEYLIGNYKNELADFFPAEGGIVFLIAEQKDAPVSVEAPQSSSPPERKLNLNMQYTFENFVEGSCNQFVKSAALGVAHRPGKSYNPLFIHGGVGLGKTHLLHAIGHHVLQHHKKLVIQSVTTEGFINDLVNHLRSKSVDKMKRFYRNLDVLLVDDIQFLQNRLNFEEEFCNTFEALINQNKQIIITSDKPPAQLKLSDRIIARMEWGLVAHIGVPELETRVAIIQQKSQQHSFHIPSDVAFFIADHIYNNVRQLEGAINRLTAYCRLMNLPITEETAETLLKEMFENKSMHQISVEDILKSVATVFEVRVSDIKGNSRLRAIATARQASMYLAKELIHDSLIKIAASFGGKTHSTVLHAWKKIAKQLQIDNTLSRQIQIVKRNIEK